MVSVFAAPGRPDCDHGHDVFIGGAVVCGSDMKHLDLFSGIGGFALAARNVGWDTVAFCEIEDYPRKVLAKHWPDVPIYKDVRDVTAKRLRSDGITADIITGGFPCQDISLAGKQVGIDGERSGLWSELARIIGEVRPRYAVLENVAALLSGDSGRWFQRVLGDLAEVGYDCEWHCIPASHVGAPHRRDRVWIIAYPNAGQCEREDGQVQAGRNTTNSGLSSVADTNHPRLEGWIREVMSERTRERTAGQSSDPWDGNWITEPGVGRVANGVSRRVDRLKGLGNAIVPQVAEVIFRAINNEMC